VPHLVHDFAPQGRGIEAGVTEPDDLVLRM
jgi:hypothetical protein